MGFASFDILLVLASLLTGLAVLSCLIAWTDRRRPVTGLVMLFLGLALFVVVHLGAPRGLIWRDIPDAFILVLARLLA